MEKAKNESEVSCPLHPSYFIIAVNMGKSEGQQLFCAQCMIQQRDFSVLSSLKTFLELIQTASHVYGKHREAVRDGEKPKEYSDLLFGQAEMMEKLNKHIEEEKKKTTILFDQMAQTMMRIIEEKKKECLKGLDQQVELLVSRFATFEKQLHKAYPNGEDLNSLYPNHEVLEKRFQSIKNFDQLASFVKDLKENILSEELSGVHRDEEANQDILKELYEELQKLRDRKPQCELNDQILAGFESKFKKELMLFCREKIILTNRIPESYKIVMRESTIVSQKEFRKIQNWLVPDHPFNPKLIYKSTRDGATPSAFHERCDAEKNTVTLIKAIFEGSEEPCVIGGYLDAGWNSQGSYITSSEAFLFSLTDNVKCPVKTFIYAAYGYPSYGPKFGLNNDLEVFQNGPDKGQVQPGTYHDSWKIIHSKQDLANKKINFKVIEVEVYSLD